MCPFYFPAFYGNFLLLKDLPMRCWQRCPAKFFVTVRLYGRSELGEPEGQEREGGPPLQGRAQAGTGGALTSLHRVWIPAGGASWVCADTRAGEAPHSGCGWSMG